MEDKDIQNWLTENNIQEVETIVPDMAGTARGKLIPVEKFTSGSVIRLPESVFTQSVTGKFLPDGYINPADRDILIRPDLTTLKLLPWMKDPTATVVNDCFYEDGSNVDISPRQVLKNILRLYRENRMKPAVAPELDPVITSPAENVPLFTVDITMVTEDCEDLSAWNGAPLPSMKP